MARLPDGKNPGHEPCRSRATSLIPSATSKSAKGAVRVGRFYVIGKEGRDPNFGLAEIDADARTWTWLARDVQPDARVFPDGAKVAWCETSPETDKPTLHVVNLRGSNPHMTITLDGFFARAYWSSDSRELLVTTYDVRNPDPNRRTVRVAADGTSKPVMLPPTELVWDWSRDGRRIVTGSTRRMSGEEPFALPQEPFYLMGIDGGEARLLKPAFPRNDPKIVKAASTPLFSPDGKTLSWSELEQERETPNIRTVRFYLAEAAGGSAREVLRTDGNVGSFCWSPTGRSIAIAVYESSQALSESRIEIIDLKGQGLHTVDLSELPDASSLNFRRLVDWH